MCAPDHQIKNRQLHFLWENYQNKAPLYTVLLRLYLIIGIAVILSLNCSFLSFILCMKDRGFISAISCYVFNGP